MAWLSLGPTCSREEHVAMKSYLGDPVAESLRSAGREMAEKAATTDPMVKEALGDEIKRNRAAFYEASQNHPHSSLGYLDDDIA